MMTTTTTLPSSVRLEACLQVAANWRLRRRLPRVTRLAVQLGLLSVSDYRR